MDFADLKNKSATELVEILKEQENKLFAVRQKAHGRELKQVHEVGSLRRTVARIKMLLANKQ